LVKDTTAYAEKLKQQVEGKDKQMTFFMRHAEASKKQVLASQTKIKELTSNLLPGMTKQLEGKIKEVEIIKEMLKSSKIELAGKEKEIKYLKSKLKGLDQTKESQAKSKAFKKTPSKPTIKNIQALKLSEFGNLNEYFREYE